MLVLHEASDFDSLVPLNLKDDEWFVTHAFDGQDTLEININSNNRYYKYMFEEVCIDAVGLRGNDARFKITGIDDHSDAVTVSCVIDLDDWKTDIIGTFRKLHTNLPDCIDEIIPDGWTYDGATGFPTDVTVEDSRNEPFKACNRIEILTGMAEIFGCTYNYDNINKVLHVINPNDEEPSGEFLSEELNLASLGFTGDSSSFATRLYAYGKRDEDGENPVTFESINDGKPYIDNFSYSDKVIAVGWSDERYTDPEHLLEAAKERLAELAKPIRSYECEVKRLQYNVWMYKVVTVIDIRRGTRENQQVIEWKEYARPDQDVVTLSEASPSIETIVNGIPDADEVISNSMNSIQQIVNQQVADATDAITGNKGGSFVWVFDAEGRPTELVNLGDTDDINTAKQVWRWNASGLGHSNNGYNGPYSMAMLADGSINASMITTGTLNAERIRAGIIQDVNGMSSWNLESGVFDIQGTIRTRATTGQEGDNSNYGVLLDPNFSASSVDQDTEGKWSGTGIRFTGGSGRAVNPWIMSEMFKSDYSSAMENGKTSGIAIGSGRVRQDGPGSFLRLTSNPSNVFPNAEDFEGASIYALASSKYAYSSTENTPDRSYLLLQASGLKADGNPSGFCEADLLATNSESSAGLRALSRTSSGEATSRLSLYGKLNFNRPESYMQSWNFATTSRNSNITTTGSCTTAYPSEYGEYRPFTTYRCDDSDCGAFIMASNWGASGGTIRLRTMPSRLSSNPDNTNYKFFGNGTGIGFHVLAILI